MICRFILVREIDETGISGTGIVAEGVQFSSGKVVMTWLTQYQSIALYDSIEEVLAIHGHNGKTRVSWLDSENKMEVYIVP